MTGVVYVHGRFVPAAEGRVSVYDRGLLFGDSVYEVTAVVAGKMIDNDLHLARLVRSLNELAIPLPLPLDEIAQVQQELAARNNLTDGLVYIQVSRGEADRDFFYSDTLEPKLFGFTQAKNLLGTKSQRDGISVDLVADPRWQRRDIKTTMLLGQVLAKQASRARGFDDVWMVEDGLVTEGASSTAHIITADGVIVTRPPSLATLQGCTQRALALLCAQQGLTIDQRAFSVEEAKSAAEAFLTSASSFVTPVVNIGGAAVGAGTPGPLTRRLQTLYLEAAGVPSPAF